MFVTGADEHPFILSPRATCGQDLCQPAALEAAKTKEFHDEYAVMVEAERPLTLADALLASEVEGYATSWARGLGLVR